MTTVDNLLTNLTTNNAEFLNSNLGKRDLEILLSLSTSVSGTLFITENQSRLLTKILKENQKILQKVLPNITEVLEKNTWSRKFRHIEQIRKCYIAPVDGGIDTIAIEFTQNGQIRKVINEISKELENFSFLVNGKKCVASLTEKNIEKIVDALTPLKFDFCEELKNYHATIKSWKFEDIKNQFLLTSIENQNFQRHITADLGLNTAISQNIINDRSMRYQFFVENPKNPGETLSEYIANRGSTKIWVDRKEHTFEELLKSLIELKRLPLLIVFDTLVNENYLKNLKILSDAAENLGLSDSVGIYFRLPNEDFGKPFNQMISDKRYNQQLDEHLKIAGVASGKIPKFFLKNAWKPMTVIALDSHMGMRHGKTAVYGNCCDLVIEYADKPSMHNLRIEVQGWQ